MIIIYCNITYRLGEMFTNAKMFTSQDCKHIQYIGWEKCSQTKTASVHAGRNVHKCKNVHKLRLQVYTVHRLGEMFTNVKMFTN